MNMALLKECEKFWCVATINIPLLRSEDHELSRAYERVTAAEEGTPGFYFVPPIYTQA